MGSASTAHAATHTRESGASREFVASRLITAGLTGGAVAAVLNVGVFLIAKVVGVTMVGQFDPAAPAATLPMGMVVVASVVPALVATGVLAIMNRLLARPGRVFAGLAAVGAVLSMGGPATLAGADTATRAALALMHLIAAGAIVGALLKMGRRPS